jgi:hypothetical protein
MSWMRANIAAERPLKNTITSPQKYVNQIIRKQALVDQMARIHTRLGRVSWSCYLKDRCLRKTTRIVDRKRKFRERQTESLKLEECTTVILRLVEKDLSVIVLGAMDGCDPLSGDKTVLH